MIRKLEPGDLARVMKIWLEGNRDAHSFVPEKYWEDNAPDVRVQLLEAEVYVWEERGEILGFAGLQGDVLAGIFVERQSRSSGIGRQLLNRCKEARPRLFLNVYQKNRRAAQFYQKEGFFLVEHQADEQTGEAQELLCWESGAPGSGPVPAPGPDC